MYRSKRLGYNPAMEAPIPDWLQQPAPTRRTIDTIPRLPRSKEGRELEVAEYNLVLPRVLEAVYEGSTLDRALKELPIHVSPGGFMRWLKANPTNLALYNEAKELRTEVWAGRIIDHATGQSEDNPNTIPEDVSRSKLIVETYKWLMQSDNRKQYGDVKQIDFGGTISITAALQEAQGRVLSAGVDEAVGELSAGSRLLLSDGEDEE